MSLPAVSFLAPGSKRADRVAFFAVALMTVALAALAARVAALQLTPGPDLSDHMQERLSKRPVPSVRGDIMDRRGRLLATTRFGYRVFVDPVDFPSPPDRWISLLADSLDIPSAPIGERIITAVAENERRTTARAAASPAATGPAASVVPAGLERTEPLEVSEPAQPDPETPADSTAPIRFVRLSGIITDEQAAAIKNLKIPGVHLEQRSVRQYPAGGMADSIVGKVGIDHDGLMGAEHTFEHELVGRDGRMLYVRDAMGHPLWMGPGAFEPAQRGGDLRLSIDLELQRIALEELERGMKDADAAGGRIILLDPLTGEVLAMADLVRHVPDAVPFPWAPARKKGDPEGAQGWAEEYVPSQRYIVMASDPGRAIHPALARNRCVEDVYEPGSTFKPFVWSTIMQFGLARVDEVFDTEGGYWRTSYGRPIQDVIRRPYMTWREVLQNSSNIGMIKGAERLSFDQLSTAVRKFGFGARTGIGLPGEASGLVTPRKKWSKYTQTSVAFGHEVAVTPVQMARAFSVFARPGDWAGTLPPIRLTALDPADPDRGIVHRVLPASIATLTRETLRQVALNMEEKMTRLDPPEKGWSYSMFAKSGTAVIPLGKPPPGKRVPRGASGYFDNQYFSSFVAGGPVEDPHLVILCVIDDPCPERVRHKSHYGAQTAGPVVRRVMDRALLYLGVPPTPAAPSGPSATAPASHETPD